MPEVAADIVSASHDHFDQLSQAVQGDFLHVNKTGTFSRKEKMILSFSMTSRMVRSAGKTRLNKHTYFFM